MIRFIRILFWSFLVFLVAGCAKDEFTMPASIESTLQLKGNTAMNGRIVFDQALINLAQVEIIGQRPNENDLFFTRNFSGEDGSFRLLGIDDNQPIQFEIPQGIYDRLALDLYLYQDNYALILDDDDDDDDGDDDDDDDDIELDLDDYFENARPSILLKGIYNNDGKTFTVIVGIDGILKLNVVGEQSGKRTVVLQKDRINIAEIEFDPEYWFGLITISALESAVKVEGDDDDDDDDDQEIIFIHKDFNQNLYSSIAGRIEASTTLRFDP